MLIVLNGQEQNIKSSNLSDCLTELGYEKAIIATAINGNFVPLNQRNNVKLEEHDRLEILAPMQGG